MSGKALYDQSGNMSGIGGNMSGMGSDMTGMSGDMPGMASGDLSNTTRDMMQSSFYWGKAAIVLFPNWPNNGTGMYILAFFFVFLLAVAAEVLSVSPSVRAGMGPTKAGAIHAAVYAFRIGFAYLVMLCVMSFNVGIFIAAVAGHTLGFFIVKARTQALANQADPKNTSMII